MGLISPVFSQSIDYPTNICFKEFLKNVPTHRTPKSVALENKYDVHHYFLDITLQNNSTYISGNVTIGAGILAPLDTFACELASALTVDSVWIDGINRNFMHTGNWIYIPVSSYPPGVLIAVRIYYHGDPQSGGGFFSGINTDTSPSWGNSVTWTLSEPFNAYEWWPCKQSLSDKADSSRVHITTNSSNKAGSNGLLKATVPVGGGKTRFEWSSHYPIAYYLISASVAAYIDYSIYAHPQGLTDSVLIQNYVYNNPQCLPYFKEKIDTTALFLELYSSLFGMYPFSDEKYGHCMAPLGGGMEHQTMTTLGYFTFYLVCHELAHQWFGDYVTCSDWSNIWINEGFASYSEYLAAEYILGPPLARAHMDEVHDNVLSEPDGSVYIPPAQAVNSGRIFDHRLSYDKGSAIIHMLRFEMQNDSNFFNTLKFFLQNYRDSVASGDDFRLTAENITGQSFADFFNQWYYGEGYRIYDLYCYYDNDTIFLQSTQTTSSATTPFFRMLMKYKLTLQGGTDTTLLFMQTQPVEMYKIPSSKAVTNLQADPDNDVLNLVGSVIISVGEQQQAPLFTVSPNPASGSFKVLFPQTNTISTGGTLRIADTKGSVYAEHEISQGIQELNLDITEFSEGIYFVSFQNRSGRAVQRVAVVH